MSPSYFLPVNSLTIANRIVTGSLSPMQPTKNVHVTPASTGDHSGYPAPLFIYYSRSECCYQHFLPVFRVRQFTNKPEIMLMLRARITVLKAKERRP